MELISSCPVDALCPHRSVTVPFEENTCAVASWNPSTAPVYRGKFRCAVSLLAPATSLHCRVVPSGAETFWTHAVATSAHFPAGSESEATFAKVNGPLLAPLTPMGPVRWTDMISG